MTRRTFALVLAFALSLSLGVPAVLAQDTPSSGPSGASTTSVGNFTLLHWVGNASEVSSNVSSGESAALWFGLGNVTQNATSPVVVFLNVTSNDPDIRVENGTLVLGTTPNATLFASARITVGPNVTGPRIAAYQFMGEAYEERNGTLVLIGPANGGAGFGITGTEAPVPPPPGLPPGMWLLLAVGLLGVLAAGLFLGRRRAQRRRMNEGPRRSQVMRELELEKQLEKAKDPEQVQEIKQEIRQQEQVREKRRELQILEAKRADALKTMELLKKRHESGGLTKLQYDNMVAKKRGDLQKIEADIAQMEAEDAGGAAAS